MTLSKPKLLLAFLEAHFVVNPAMRQAILDLCDEQ